MAPARSFNRPKLQLLLFALAGIIVVLAAITGHAGAQAQRATPGWSVCNETSYVLEAATGRPEGRSVVVQGWTRLRPGECKVAVNAPLARGTHYLYARTSTAHRGGRRQWGGDATLCVDPGDQFSIENPPACAAMGLEERDFRRIQINKRDSWRTSFAEAQPYTLARARAAGMQRLLIDAGYEIREGRGGVDPRRIAQAVAQFRSSARLQPGANEDQLIDALETAARRRAEQLGLTLCNRTRGHLWTAMARRRGEGWESRGWWGLAPGSCVRTLDESLLQDRYFIYASLEGEQGSRLLAAPGEPFCTSPARFAILGRETCENRYYDTTLFSPIDARNRRGMVVEFHERDFLAPGERPQQLQASGHDDTAPTQSGVRRGIAPASAPSGQPAPTAPTQSRPPAGPARPS
jgi:uncharacterized membrane protein